MLARIFSLSTWRKLYKALKNLAHLDTISQSDDFYKASAELRAAQAVKTDELKSALRKTHQELEQLSMLSVIERLEHLEARITENERDVEDKLVQIMHYQVRSLQQRIDQIAFDLETSKKLSERNHGASAVEGSTVKAAQPARDERSAALVD